MFLFEVALKFTFVPYILQKPITCSGRRLESVLSCLRICYCQIKFQSSSRLCFLFSPHRMLWQEDKKRKRADRRISEAKQIEMCSCLLSWAFVALSCTFTWTINHWRNTTWGSHTIIYQTRFQKHLDSITTSHNLILCLWALKKQLVARKHLSPWLNFNPGCLFHFLMLLMLVICTVQIRQCITTFTLFSPYVLC